MELTMKKYITVITDADVRFEIETAATGLEEENQIHFPDSNARTEFLEDGVSCILDKFDLYEHYRPDYCMEILDTAKLYGYLL